MNQLLKKIWYRFTDRSDRVPPIRILALAAVLIVLLWLFPNWPWQTLVVIGLGCAAVGFRLWLLERRLRRRQRWQEKPAPKKVIRL